MTSPYLERPLRTLEEARRDIEKARRKAGLLLSVQSTPPEQLKDTSAQPGGKREDQP